MASSETMRDIVTAGCDLTINESPGIEALLDIAAIAVLTGSRLTISADIGRESVQRLIEAHGKRIAFVVNE